MTLRSGHGATHYDRFSWTTSVHFRWGAVRRLEPDSSRLLLLIFPPRTTAWQRRCASTAAVPICGWSALLVGFLLYVVGLRPGIAMATAIGLFVLSAVVIAVNAAPTRRGSIELVALEPSHPAADIRSGRLRGSTELMAELVNADTAFVEGHITQHDYDVAWADAYQRAARLAKTHRT